MANNTKKKHSAARKLIPAAGMLAVSAAMLASSTYAWFTMNKEVTVTGMEMKAKAEEGLLINEVKTANSDAWDDAATANTTPILISLRPASTSDMGTFWHANSKQSSDEAGADELGKTVADASGNYFTNVTIGQTGISDEALVAAAAATGNTKAETHVSYKDSYLGGNGTENTYDDGEGFYVKYTYYLKSSGEGTIETENLQAKVTATLKDNTATSGNLDKSLRVGIVVPQSTTANAGVGGYKIFAPIYGADTSYSVANDAKATSPVSVTAIAPTDASTPIAYTKLNTTTTGASPTTTKITIPSSTSDGIPVYVYVWFEGEDQNCKSDNIAATLDTYDIDISFTIPELF